MARRPHPALLALLLLSGCTAGSDPAAAPTGDASRVRGTSGSAEGRQSRTSGGPTPPCPTDASYPPGPTGFPEVKGDGGREASLWALLFLDGNKLRAGRETKIVFRMTGRGALSIHAVGPVGTVDPTWLKEHGGSSWQRPGDEWGTGWNFPAAGCWTVSATRAGGATATLTLRVA